eukprot:Rhum_TRINITY_DN8889_c0_g1::Rhum_TRINITY_DN8889_c0_g1_i1::g.30371::m.30371/K08955/YME1; ATP-dependent metalloprotease
MNVCRVSTGRRGLCTVTLGPCVSGVRGGCAAVSFRFRAASGAASHRRFYGGGPLPMPPPPPPPPPMYSGGGGQGRGQSRQPLVVTMKATKMDLFFRSSFLLAMLGTAGMLVLAWNEVRFGSKNRDGLFTTNAVTAMDLEKFTTTFSEVLGCDEAKEELEEIVLFLKEPERFTRLGGKLPKGALMVGPPGTGKTMLAKAIAKEAGVPFFYMSGAEFDEVFMGVGSRRVRDLFEAAKKAAPALIFIDEIDAIGGKRTARAQSYQRMTLNQLLSEMDGFLSSDKVIVLGATNTPKSLDSALTRPGRLDRMINIDPPDVKGREAILKLYLSKIKKAENVDAAVLARGLPGYCGADLKNIVNTAAIHAAMLDKDEVDDADLEYSRDRVSMGAENRSKVVPEKELRVTAWHEAGHALAALLSEGADPVHKATIVPRGSGVLGLVIQHPVEDRYSASRQGMLARLVVCLAGRAGEQALLGDADVTSGAASDFEQATSLARTMVRKYGMCEEELGVVDYSAAEDYQGAYLSEETKEKIETATRELLDSAYTEATRILREHRSELEGIAEGLLTHETLNAQQLKLIIDGGTLPPVGRAEKAEAADA